jgi:hypothetical protein
MKISPQSVEAFTKIAEDMCTELLKANELTWARAMMEKDNIDEMSEADYTKMVSENKEHYFIPEEIVKCMLVGFAVKHRIVALVAGLMKKDVEGKAYAGTMIRYAETLKDIFWALSVTKSDNPKLQSASGISIRKMVDGRIILFEIDQKNGVDPSDLMRKILGGGGGGGPLMI